MNKNWKEKIHDGNNVEIHEVIAQISGLTQLQTKRNSENTSSFYASLLEKVQIEYEDFQQLSDEKALEKMNHEYNEAISYITEEINAIQKRLHVTQTLLENMKRWQIPSSQHLALKNTCIQTIERLKESLESSLMYWYRYRVKTEKLPLDAWKKQEEKDFIERIQTLQNSYEETLEEEIAKKEWLEKLTENLNIIQNHPKK